MAKEKLSADEKLEKQDFDLFKALEAIDRKDYGYYDRLTPEQQRKFSPFMLIQWSSTVKSNSDVQSYYLRNIDYVANKYLLDENVHKHPKLVWLMLCAASPGLGKQYHQWIPHIKERVVKLQESPKTKDIKDYFAKIYPKVSASDLKLLADAYVAEHTKKMYIASQFPDMHYDEIELLSELVTDEDIKEYEESLGNI